ncbi:hypothetical protein ACFDR9_004096, partial [Janthinobacterium sp. CG_23.3]
RPRSVVGLRKTPPPHPNPTPSTPPPNTPSPPPPLPADVIDKTQAKYFEAIERLTGQKLKA